MTDIQAVWREHELARRGVVELVSIEWIVQYRGRDVSPPADLPDGTIVTLDGLWEDIRTYGLRDPLLMRVGLISKTFRLEAGNHRIQILYAQGVKEVPVTVQVTDYCGPDAPTVMTDATHVFPFGEEIAFTEPIAEYMRPRAVFQNIP